jgi:UTP pyrophosphatase
MHDLKYLAGYSPKIIAQVGQLVAENRLGNVLLQRYPKTHTIRTDRALYDFTVAIKNEFLRTTPPLSRVAYDGKIHVLNNALGTHTFVSRVQGSRLKAKNEIRIAAIFRDAPLEFLKMIVVHELAHLKEKEHGKAFFQLCTHMEPVYHQLEFDTRLFLTQVELAGSPYQADRGVPEVRQALVGRRDDRQYNKGKEMSSKKG